MAKVSATLEVVKIIQGYGFRGVERYTTKEGEHTNYFTVWTDDLVAEGDKVEVEGVLSVKLESFTGRDNQPKTVAASHINNAKVKAEADLPF